MKITRASDRIVAVLKVGECLPDSLLDVLRSSLGNERTDRLFACSLFTPFVSVTSL